MHCLKSIPRIKQYLPRLKILPCSDSMIHIRVKGQASRCDLWGHDMQAESLEVCVWQWSIRLLD